MRVLMLLGTFVFFMTVPFLSAGFAQPTDWSAGPWGWHYMWGAWGIGMMFFMLLFWVLIIAGVIAFVRWLWGGPDGAARAGETAKEILKNRFAKGEIDKEEFDLRLRDLRGAQ